MTDRRRTEEPTDGMVEVRERQRAPRNLGREKADATQTRVPEEGRSPVSKGPDEGAEAHLAEDLAEKVTRTPEETDRVPEEGRSPVSKGPEDSKAYDGPPGQLAEEADRVHKEADRVPEEGALAPVSKGPFADLEGVVGVGIDVVGITAFAEQLEQPGTRFAQAFTPGERRAARSGAGSEAESLAARWAAKEAVIKAWSSTRYGQEEVIDPAHVDLREIEVRSDAWGRPAIRLHGAIADSMADYTVFVSLTHDESADVAAAFVVLQEKPGG